tara:strand:+ start:6495 stop:6827 length:333 start_codon:yes stop_codon:yes gene_type:complete
MDNEDESLPRKEWELIRAKTMKKLFPNAPIKSVCRICKGTFPNPILNGSAISVSMCYECRKPYMKKNHSKKKKTKIPKPNIVEMVDTKVTYEKKDLEEIKTLKDYLEMKL